MQNQKPRFIASHSGMLRDQFLWQIKMKIGRSHGRSFEPDARIFKRSRMKSDLTRFPDDLEVVNNSGISAKKCLTIFVDEVG